MPYKLFSPEDQKVDIGDNDLETLVSHLSTDKNRSRVESTFEVPLLGEKSGREILPCNKLLNISSVLVRRHKGPDINSEEYQIDPHWRGSA